MKRYKPFLLGMLAGTALTFVALRYHVVRHEDGVSLVPRSPQPPLRSVYSDVRDWGSAMWEQHPEVAQALITNDQVDVISDAALHDVSLQMNEFYRQSSEKLQGLLSEYQSERARMAMAEIETTSVSIEEHGDNSGVNIGRFPQGMFQNPVPGQQVPIVEEPQSPLPRQQPAPQTPPPSDWRNPFHFQQRRTNSPTVGADDAVPSSSDAVAQRSRDPWLRQLSQASQLGDEDEFISSIPATLNAELSDEQAIEGWLPGLLSSLIATDGETMHGQAHPSTLDVNSESPEVSDQQSILQPEALREPIIQVRPF